MIKEIWFKKNKKNESCYKCISIDAQMKQPAILGIDILNEVDYFNEQLQNTVIYIKGSLPKADWIPVERWTEFVCVSKKFKDVFKDKLKGYWYPTNNENYFIFLLNNCIQGLDEERTDILNHEERAYWYKSIEHEVFKPNIENNEYLFTLPQEPLRILSTSKFETLYRQNNLKGIQFYREINFNRANGSRFDGLRFKSYDDDGNCLSNNSSN